MNGLEQMVLNRVLCKECGEVLISYHRHDYKTCKCPNQTMVDGGNDYQRYGGHDMSKVDRSISIYLSDDHEKMRYTAHWGNRGKDGKQPLQWKCVADMSDQHLQAVLDTQTHAPEWMRKIMQTELDNREKTGEHVPD